jgi:type IV pilus assembly protein PilA
VTALRTSGYSLVDILMVVFVVGLLAAILTPNLRRAVATANDAATKAYIHHVIKGVEAERDIATMTLPPAKTCAALTHLQADPLSVASCTYVPNAANETYTVTATSVTGKTFYYDGAEVVELE